VMGIGSNGPAEASGDDLKGWSSTQVFNLQVNIRWSVKHTKATCKVLCLPLGPRLAAWLFLLAAAQIVAFLDKLAELRSLQPLHPSVTRK